MKTTRRGGLDVNFANIFYMYYNCFDILQINESVAKIFCKYFVKLTKASCVDDLADYILCQNVA